MARLDIARLQTYLSNHLSPLAGLRSQSRRPESQFYSPWHPQYGQSAKQGSRWIDAIPISATQVNEGISQVRQAIRRVNTERHELVPTSVSFEDEDAIHTDLSEVPALSTESTSAPTHDWGFDSDDELQPVTKKPEVTVTDDDAAFLMDEQITEPVKIPPATRPLPSDDEASPSPHKHSILDASPEQRKSLIPPIVPQRNSPSPARSLKGRKTGKRSPA